MAIGTGLEYAEKFTSASSSHTTAAQVTQASGSTIVISVAAGSTAGVFNTPTDNKSNTYTAIASEVQSPGSGARSQWWYCANATGGSGHTFTSSSAGSDVRSIFVTEITGGLTSGILDQSTAGLMDSSSPFTSNTSGTTTQAAELWLAFVATDTVSGTETITWGNSFTQSVALGDANFVTGGVGKQIVSSTGTITSSITSSGAGTTGAVSFVASFKEAAATDTLFGQALT